MDTATPIPSTVTALVLGPTDNGRRFVTEVTITEGAIIAVHGRRHAVAVDGTPVSWRETHIFELNNGDVTRHWPHVPTEAAAALVAGTNPPLSPIPVTLKARVIARAVGVLARVLRPMPPHHDSPADANRELVGRYVEQFKNQQKFQVFPKFFGHTFRHHFDFGGQPDSAASFVNVGVNLLAGFPDVHVELIHLIAEGDLVVEHNVVTATHRGTWAGQPATGRSVTWNEAHIYRVNNGRIVENWPAVNFDHLLLQIQP